MRIGNRRLWALLIASIGPVGCAPDAHGTVESTQKARQALDSSSAWIKITSMNAARREHAALLLSDKRVLVVGGTDDNANAGEFYQATEDPNTNEVTAQWTPLAGPDSFVISSKSNCRPAIAQINDQTVLVVSTDWNGNTSKVSTLDLQTLEWTSRFDLPNATCLPSVVDLENNRALILADDSASGQVLPFIYDTTTHTVAATAALPTPKEGTWINSAVLKLSGKQVLVSGGAGQNVPVKNKDSVIFDPSDPNGPWVTAGEMTIRRANHALALLPNKNVLAVGGYAQGPFDGQWAETAEIFDVNAKAWGAVAPMSNARIQGHTATTLDSGLILVIGGSISSTAELFDPSSNEWTVVERSDDTRYYGHSSTLLDTGQVLVSGGVSIVNGMPDTGTNNAALCNALVFAWQPQNGIAADPRGFHSSTFLDEKTLLVVGGANEAENGTLQSLQDAWVYNINDGASTAAQSPHFPRAFHTATKLNDGRIFVAGGYDESAIVSEIYGPDPSSDPNAPSYIWTEAAALPSATKRAVATLLDDGTVLHVGGIYVGDANDVAHDVLLYKPDSDAWESPSLPDLPENPNRFGHTLTKLSDGSVLAIGGFTACPSSNNSQSAVASVARYYPATKTWTAVKSMNQGRGFHTATLLKNGQVLIAGGGGNISEDCLRPTWNTVHASAEVYDSVTDTWTTVGVMNESRTEHEAILLASTKVLIAGGRRTSTGRTLSTAELYDSDTKTWSTTSRLQKGRFGHSLNLGPTGVLAIGGFRAFPPSEADVDIELFPQGPQGSDCSLDEQCESGICSGGVCCNESCDNLCQACSMASAKSRDKETNKKEMDGVCEDISGCSDFACLPETGLCKTECTDVDDCVPGHVCNPLNQCVDAIPNASTLDPSGCRASTTESSSPPWGSILLVAGTLALRRYRRHARIQGN